MAKNWTAAQQAAMNIKDKTLLVSAAAGSGKTATLTERIIRSITDPIDPADISKMLIVTFTRAAADELKGRIFTALGDAIAKDPTNRYLSGQLVKLGSAKICTIDSFYLELVRSNFSKLGIPASIRIGDTAELEVLSKEIMEETVDRFYDTDESFSAFAECFTGTRSSDQLADILISVYEQTVSIPDGIDFLRKKSEQLIQQADENTDFFKNDFGKEVKEQTADVITHCLTVFSSACEYLSCDEALTAGMLPSFEYDKNFCQSLLTLLSSPEITYEKLRNHLSLFSPVRLKRVKEEHQTPESLQYKALRTDLHKKIRDLEKHFYVYTVEELKKATAETAHYTALLYRVLQYFESSLSAEKRKRKILDFNDVRRLTLQLLVEADGTPTEIAKQYATQYSAIYIDEYQDVDQVQDMIFRAIATPTNRFMVGDIKQSIYGFRGAEPLVFSHYRSTFPSYTQQNSEHSDALTVFMSENFRCDENVISFTNLVCSRIFSACTKSIGYTSDDDLRFSKLLPHADYCSPLVEVSVIMTGQDKDIEEMQDVEEEPPEKKALEADYIAREIHRLIQSEKKADGTPIVAGDIAVLFRSRSMSTYVSTALRSYGILSSESDGDRYFENPDVLMVLCLLNAVDNPHRDIFLTGTLRSPLYGFTMEDLIQIRSVCDASFSLYDALIACKEKTGDLADRCRRFDASLNELRRIATSLPVDRFLRVLFESDLFVSSGFFSDRTECGDGGNLLRLYEYARTFEAGSFKGLYNFIEFINTIIDEDKKMKIPPKGTSPDRVNLMTIHQSKGLEFPVCFLCGIGNRFNRQDQYASLLFDYPTGIAMKLSDTSGFARINTPLREALVNRIRSRQCEEEMRVLYVAMTRARERLYLTAIYNGTEEGLADKITQKAAFGDRYSLLRCNSYLEWVLLPFFDESKQVDCAKLTLYKPFAHIEDEEDISTSDVITPTVATPTEEIEMDVELYQELKEKFSFRYPFSDFRRIPAKISVSRLSPSALDETSESGDTIFDEKKTTIPSFFLSDKPSRVSSAERGTATHLFLQFCDFKRIKQFGVEEELGRLIEKRFLPATMKDLVFVNELNQFAQSTFFTQIEKAAKIIREQRFNLFLCPSLFTKNQQLREHLKHEKMAVQGVIDLILIEKDGSIALYDYKTDRLSQDELSDLSLAQKKMNERHGLQLSYYAAAVEALFDRPCKSICVYSTHAACLFEIERVSLSIPDMDLDSTKQ